MSELIELELKNNIAKVSLNRPDKKNALTLEMLQNLARIGENLKNENDISCVIINGKGGTFSSGIDVTSFIDLANDQKLLHSLMAPLEGHPYNKMQKPCLIWQELSVPVIAILEGPVFGAGLQLALGADIRISAKNTELSIMETKWGLIPDMGLTQTLPKIMNYDQALLATIKSNLIKAEEAKDLGLVTMCCADPYKESMALAEGLTYKSPDAIRLAKTLYQKAWNTDNTANLKLEAFLQTQLIGTPNQMEAVLANIEKRNPKFDRNVRSDAK